MTTNIKAVKEDVAQLEEELGVLESFERKIDDLERIMRKENEQISELEREQLTNFNLTSKVRGLHLNDEKIAELCEMLNE